jgi:hypothetical protein
MGLLTTKVHKGSFKDHKICLLFFCSLQLSLLFTYFTATIIINIFQYLENDYK